MVKRKQQATIARLTAENERLTGELDEARATIADLARDRNKTVDMWTAASARAEAAEREVERLTGEHEAAYKRIDEIVKEDSDLLEEKDDEIRRLATLHREAKAEIVRLTEWCQSTNQKANTHFDQSCRNLVRAEAAETSLAVMREELTNIVKADWRSWDEEVRSSEAFVQWAKSRARHCLGLALPATREETSPTIDDARALLQKANQKVRQFMRDELGATREETT